MMQMMLDEAVAAMVGHWQGGLDHPGRGYKPLDLAHVAMTGVSTDSRTLRVGQLFFAIRGASFDGHAFIPQAWSAGACACVADEIGAESLGGNVDGPLIIVNDTVAALGRLARHHRRGLRATVIAVTGSNGKTTTKNMLAHVLGSWRRCSAALRSFNNQIGVPLTLLAAALDDDFLVVEIGTNSPGEVAALAEVVQPDAGMVTCIGDAHLAGLGGREGVVREKMALFDHVRPGGEALIDCSAARRAGYLPRQRELHWTTYGRDVDAGVRISAIDTDVRRSEALLDSRWRLTLEIGGAHNAINAAGVFALCRRLGMSPEAIVAALATFRPPEWRLQVRDCAGVTVVADCYNANPTSMAAAIDLLAGTRAGRRVLVVGEMAELGTEGPRLHREVGVLAARRGIEVVVSIGRLARYASEAAVAAGAQATVRHFADAASAVVGLQGFVRTGDVVLIKGSRSARLERIVEGLSAVEPAGAVVVGA
jgi:UDP-N-acetylmuramoyl-tripeptide--D-alanyl-D-alanine ligase